MTIKVEKITPPLAEPKDALRVLDYLRTRQKALELLSPYRSEVTVQTDAQPLPLRINHVGDTHLSHDHANPYALLEAVDEAGEQGMVGHETKEKGTDPLKKLVVKEGEEAITALQGNIIDSVSSKFISTNTVHVGLPLDGQVRLAREILRRRKGSVIPISLNTCHEGWAMKTSTHDPTTDLVDDDVPILYTGGQIIFQKGDRPVGRVELYHNPGKGNTQQSPEGADRARYREISDQHPDSPDAIISAHTHRLVAGQDVSRNPMTREDRIVSLGVVGTAKGTGENPDTFLIGLGVPPRNQPADAGQGLTTIWRYNEQRDKLDAYPVADYKRARILYEAVLLFELARRANAVEDLKGFIQETGLFHKPILALDKDQSLTRPSDEAAQSEGAAPLYKTVDWNLDSNLPVSIQFVGNTRVGSTSFQREAVNSLLTEISNDPWRFWVATRRLINQGTALNPDRFDTLQSLADVLKKGKNSLLGIMLTDELRRHAWGRTVGRGKDKVDPLYPGDWLYGESDLKGTPLIMPETVMNLDMPGHEYSLYIKDRLSNLTSLINPFHGLTRVSELWGVQADALVGGNTEVVGWRTWMKPTGQLEIVVPGGFAEYIEKGIGNRVDYPQGGQGLVLFPGRKLLYSFANLNDVRDYHQALWLFEGLNQLNQAGLISLNMLKSKFKTRK